MWTIIIILVVLWLLGFFGPRFSSSFPKTGNLVHALYRHRCHSPHFEAPWGSVDLSSFDDQIRSVGPDGVLVLLKRQGICHLAD